MASNTRWIFHSLAIMVMAALATGASAQVGQPNPKGTGNPGTGNPVNPNPQPKTDTKTQPKTDTKTDTKTEHKKTPEPLHLPAHLQPHMQPHTQPNNALRPVVEPPINMFAFRPQQSLPAINSWPGFPMSDIYPAAFQPFYGQSLPVDPWTNPLFAATLPSNPWANPLLGNPLLMNPLLRNPLPGNPFGIPGFGLPAYGIPGVIPGISPPGFMPPGYGPSIINPFTYPGSSTPPMAVQLPGMLLYQGPNQLVDPQANTVVHPLSGTATVGGNTYYRIPTSGMPGNPSTGVYYSPQSGTYFNSSTGVVSKPAQSSNPFVGYMW
jgi:hypothetical protein